MGTNARTKASPRKADFSVADVLGDFAAAYRLLDAGHLDNHAGQMVAVLGGKVVGAGPDGTTLRKAVSQAHRVHPERIAIIRVVAEATVLGKSWPRSS
jgi:hypothetical protein